jgi:hypothetical protein
MDNSSNQTRRDYEWQICERLSAAQVAPFKKVSIDDWRPEIGKCHENVDRWVQANPECTAMRGWVVYASYGNGMVGVTAHSIVRGSDGHLFDITPVSDERVRPGMLFVHHNGDDASFDALRAGNGFSFTCPPDMADGLYASFGNAGHDPFSEFDNLK